MAAAPRWRARTQRRIFSWSAIWQPAASLKFTAAVRRIAAFPLPSAPSFHPSRKKTHVQLPFSFLGSFFTLFPSQVVSFSPNSLTRTKISMSVMCKSKLACSPNFQSRIFNKKLCDCVLEIHFNLYVSAVWRTRCSERFTVNVLFTVNWQTGWSCHTFSFVSAHAVNHWFARI